MMNTFTATAGAALAWSALEAVFRGKASMLGAASGMVAGLVAVTPAAGFVGPVGAIVLGVIASGVLLLLRAGGEGALRLRRQPRRLRRAWHRRHRRGDLTGVFASTALGGIGYPDGVAMAGQVVTQIKAVCVTIVWCGVVSFILYKLVDMIIGLRVAPETEREGLDLAEHGERAYVY